MSKSKFIEDPMSRQYKINYAEILAKLNPKPTEADLEKLREKYAESRKNRGERP